MKQKVRLDSNGIPFEFPTLILDKAEFGKIVSEINSYYSIYVEKKYATHYSTLDDGCCMYLFENHGFNDYNIYEKFYI